MKNKHKGFCLVGFILALCGVLLSSYSLALCITQYEQRLKDKNTTASYDADKDFHDRCDGMDFASAKQEIYFNDVTVTID